MTNKRENAAIVATINTAGDMVNGSLQLMFSNGRQLQLQLSDLNATILEHSVLHGLKQKLVDAAAMSRNPDTGRSATIDDKYNAVKTVFDRLLSGSWNAVREGGGNAGGLLFRALCRMYEGKKSADQIREYLENKSDAEKAALRKNPKVAAIIDTLRAEKNDDGENSDDLLAELNDD